MSQVFETVAGEGKQTGQFGAAQDRLRILMVTPRYFPFMGGVENHVFQVARRLAASAVEITVLSTDPNGYLLPYEEVDGVKIRRTRAYPSGRDYYWAPGIYRAITQEPWDLVHVQSYHTLVAPLAMLASLRARVPYVLTFHGGGSSSALRGAVRPVQQAFLRPLLARAQRLIAVARFEIDQFSRQLGINRSRFVLIPNGADLDKRPAGEATTHQGPLIASLGRLERYKGHHRILAAMPFILEQYPNARLWIAGTGPYETELKQQAAQLGIADKVDIYAIPISDRQAMADQLTKISLVTLLSEYETQPIAVLEALYLGRPALVASTSGLQELAQQGLACAIPIESSPSEVAHSVVECLRHPLIPAASTLPTWDACARDLLEVYRTVVRNVACAS